MEHVVCLIVSGGQKFAPSFYFEVKKSCFRTKLGYFTRVALIKQQFIVEPLPNTDLSVKKLLCRLFGKFK